ncbi:MAG: reprolysin-like metallopeptidase [Acidobacteriota bacterium]
MSSRTPHRVALSRLVARFRPLRRSLDLVCSLALAFAFVLLAAPAQGATYVPMSDQALVDGAPVIVEVSVVEVEDTASQRLPARDVQVNVERVLKGSVAGSTLVVRIPGGRLADGSGWLLPGTPELGVGERAILLLAPRQDGTFAIHQLMLGSFIRVMAEPATDGGSGSVPLALRRLEHAEAVELPGRKVALDPRPRHYERFAEWIQARGEGQEGPEYRVDLDEDTLDRARRSMVSKFNLFTGPGGFNLRWLEFDSSGSVTWLASDRGQLGLDGGGFSEFQSALGAWNSDSSTPIQLNYGGPTATLGGFGAADGINAILFDDPNDLDLFTEPFDCNQGGVLALGGPRFDTDLTHTFRGATYLTIPEAEVVTNAGAECIYVNPQSAAEIFAHEIGHTLGLRHSCGDSGTGACDTTIKDEALMRAIAHLDNRGAQLGADDRDAIAFLYAPDAGLPCVPSATVLCLNNDRFRVEAQWTRPNGDNGLGQGVELTDDTGYFWFFNSSNVEMVIKVLDACALNPSRFWVFAGGLTNVQVDITVTDTETNMAREYGNPLRTPFQPIQDTVGFDTCP